MKEDERRFLLDIYNRCRNGYAKKDGISPREIINEEGFYMHYKRAWRILEKWSGKDWYEWGVTMDLGWLTPNGMEKAKELSL